LQLPEHTRVEILEGETCLLLCTLLIVTLSRDTDAESEWATLDTSLPDLLVQLGIETNVGCTLQLQSASSFLPDSNLDI
jgi:hypothetical protein